METKFTKGEWVADIRGGCCAVYEKAREDDTPGMHDDDDRNIYYSRSGAKYNGRHWEMSEEAKANAHLIAAAPEMYEALYGLYYGAAITGDDSEWVDDVGAILAKARGES